MNDLATLTPEKILKTLENNKRKCDCCLEKKKLNKKIGFLRGVSYNYYLCDDCEEEAYKEMNKRGDY